MASSLTEVQWQGKSIPVKNERIRVSLIKLNQLVNEVGRTEEREKKMTLFERLLMECQDSTQLVRDELNQDSVSVINTLLFFKLSEDPE